MPILALQKAAKVLRRIAIERHPRLASSANWPVVLRPHRVPPKPPNSAHRGQNANYRCLSRIVGQNRATPQANRTLRYQQQQRHTFPQHHAQEPRICQAMGQEDPRRCSHVLSPWHRPGRTTPPQNSVLCWRALQRHRLRILKPPLRRGSRL